MPEIGLSLRPASAADEAFLAAVYASTRLEEMAQWGWPPEQREMFLRMQYQARRQSYADSFPGFGQSIVEIDGSAAGSMIVFRAPFEIRLVDIELLPEHRGRGIGLRLLADLAAEAGRSQMPLRLSVRQGNRAIHLYQRLGFVSTGENAMYIEMELNGKSSA